MSFSGNSGLNKDALFGEWLSSNRWRQTLARKATYKALDIPDEDVEINAQRTGIGPGGVAAIVAAATLGPLGMAGISLLSEMTDQPPVPPVAPQPAPVVSAADANFEIRFFDADGKLIDIPQHAAE